MLSDAIPPESSGTDRAKFRTPQCAASILRSSTSTRRSMDRTVLIATTRDLAASAGFRRARELFWRKGPEITTFAQLQSSRWAQGVYVNVGVLPNTFITKKTPPGASYWARADRADSLDSPYCEVFRRLALDGEDGVAPAEVRQAIGWLFSWINDHLGDAAVLRANIRESPYKDEPGILEDWARGELKDPRHYWPNTRYYE